MAKEERSEKAISNDEYWCRCMTMGRTYREKGVVWIIAPLIVVYRRLFQKVGSIVL